MSLDADVCYRAVLARDARWDGRFFVASAATGTYCRPHCRARKPARAGARFFRTAAEAERQGFRACFRCRPERAPGCAHVDALPRIVAAAVARIDAGALADGSIDELAGGLGVTARHLRRAMRAELGIAPAELARSRRLALARQLVEESALTMTEIAFASEFRSLRRFNALFAERYGVAPSDVRRRARADAGESVTVRLEHRAPYAWGATLAYLAGEHVGGVDAVADGVWARTVRVGPHRGWVAAYPAASRPEIVVEVSLSLVPALAGVVARVRRLFDVDADIGAIEAHLRGDRALARALTPGLRAPGAFDGFETAARIVLGARAAGRLAGAFGGAFALPYAGLSRTFPGADEVARLAPAELARAGILGARARAVVDLARAAAGGEISLEPGGDDDDALARIVGPAAAEAIAARALRRADAFPAKHLGLATIDPTRADAWRPWRAYAAMHLLAAARRRTRRRTR